MTSTAVVLVPTPPPKRAIPIPATTPTPTQAALAVSSTNTSEDVGILQPPDDIRSIIDKTAMWVARNGVSFEQKVKEKQKESNQFAFLRPGNPYYAYYQQKVREIRRVEVIAEIGDKESVENAVEIKMRVKKALLGELPLEGEGEAMTKSKKKSEPSKKDNLEPPSKEEWVLEKPNISALQDDIIKLSAQFVARNGRAFQSGLLEREHKNPQFGFLQNYHPLHQYFKKLVTDYTKCLLPEKSTIEKLSTMSHDKQGIIERVMKKVQWEKAQKKTEEEKRREEEAERNAMSLIDWHDFAVVQVIEWEDEEDEDDDETEGEVHRAEAVKVVEPSVTPAPDKTTKAQSTVLQPPPEEVEQDDEDMVLDDDDEFEPEPQRTDLPIRPDFNPRSKPASNTDLKYVTPSGQQITPSEAEITMRIELSNTKVIEQRKQEALNERDSNLAEGDEISKHLKNFAARRNDIFGDELGLGPEENKKSVVEKPTWDGHSSSIQRVAMEALGGMSVQQQIKAIHESKGLAGETQEPAIGPKLTGTRTSASVIRPPEPARPQPPPPSNVNTSRPVMPPGYPPMYGTPSSLIRQGPFPIPMSAPPHFTPAPRMNPLVSNPGVVPSMSGVATGLKSDRSMGEEPPVKRQKVKEKKDEITKKLVGEREFLEAHPGPVNIVIKVPNQTGTAKWPAHLNGSTYRIQVLISDTIKTLKQKLAELSGMPANKQKLRAEELGFLKDAKTLAFYNATDNIEVELGVKERGGRKK